VWVATAMKCELLLVQNEVERTERMGTMRWRSLFVAPVGGSKTAARTLETQREIQREIQQEQQKSGNYRGLTTERTALGIKTEIGSFARNELE